MIKAALNGQLDKEEFYQEPFFGLSIPRRCPDVPNAMLNPRDTWPNETHYDEKAKDLAQRFRKNFTAFAAGAGPEITQAGPLV